MTITHLYARQPMLHVSLIVEALRAQPSLVVLAIVIAQGALWILVPTLTYDAMPGALPEVLAIGHEWSLGARSSPPLAYWLAEVAFRLAGNKAIGLYLLSQICIALTYWAVYALGRPTVGSRHSVIAVLLMPGIFAFTSPSVEFGPDILAIPLSALALLYYWRAISERSRSDWLACGTALGLLLLTTYAGLILIGLIVAFTLANKSTREAAMSLDALGCVLVIVVVNFLPLIWLDRAAISPFQLNALSQINPIGALANWAFLIGLLVAHLSGLILLAAIGASRSLKPDLSPIFERGPMNPLAKRFVYFFAFTPALLATAFGAIAQLGGPAGGIGSVLILAPLALIVAAGDTIRLHRQKIIGIIWTALLLAPPLIATLFIFTAPFVPIELRVADPAKEMAQFFSETFERRTGRPLELVAGDSRLASLIAAYSPSRPSVALDSEPALFPLAAKLAASGAIVVWPLSTQTGAPPASLRERFPNLIAEVPRSFPRQIQGRRALFRVGWAMVRPDASR